MKKFMFLILLCSCSIQEDQVLDDILTGAQSVTQKVIEDSKAQIDEQGRPKNKPKVEVVKKKF